MKPVTTNINFGNANFVPLATNNFHPMKGPMTTQTLQDIIGHEPFHWRGDREALEEFDGTFTNLQGRATSVTTNDMVEFKNFLATIRFAPNPFRQFDNSLSTSIALPGQLALGRGTLPAGAQLPNGNAVNGQTAFRLTTSPNCIICHTLPTGMGTDMRFNGIQWLSIATGPLTNHHIAQIELERSSELPFKVPSLRNMFDKFGMDLMHTNSRAGFGFSHDGSVDTLPRFIQDAFSVTNDQTAADVVAFLLSLTGSDLIPGVTNDINRSPGVPGLDTPAAVGRQITISNSTSVPLIDTMVALANSSTSRVDLIVKGFKSGLPRGWFLDRNTGNFQSDRQTEIVTPASLRALATIGAEQTYTVVPRGCGRRMGIDRDADGYLDRDELDFGSDPANPLSLATNTFPQLGPVTNIVTIKGRLLTLTFTATDSDIPTQKLTFNLIGPPPGATINPTNGVFTWTPSGGSGPITNSITVEVIDNGTPNRADRNSFTVIANDLTVGSLTVGASTNTLTWPALPGITYRLQYKDNLTDPTWLDVPGGDILATNTVALKTDAVSPTNTARFYRLLAVP
jgi:hypothetical protein